MADMLGKKLPTGLYVIIILIDYNITMSDVSEQVSLHLSN